MTLPKEELGPELQTRAVEVLLDPGAWEPPNSELRLFRVPRTALEYSLDRSKHKRRCMLSFCIVTAQYMKFVWLNITHATENEVEFDSCSDDRNEGRLNGDANQTDDDTIS